MAYMEKEPGETGEADLGHLIHVKLGLLSLGAEDLA